MAIRLPVNILHHSRDQLCSLAFPLGNIYFVACSYARGFRSNPFHECSKPALWGVPFLLATLPLVARFGQSIRRYWDSGLITHLINVRILLSVGPLKLDHFFSLGREIFYRDRVLLLLLLMAT